jgi:hypothetical protein
MSDEVAPLRLDQQILAETREVKKRQRARRSGLKPGPGRPDFTEIGGTRPTSSPLPKIVKSKSTAALGKSSKLSKNQRGSQSTTGLGSGIGGSTKKKETKEPHLEGEESSGDKYVDRVHILQLEVRQSRDVYNSLREAHRKMHKELQALRDRLVNLKREDDVEENRRKGMELINTQRNELESAKKQLGDTLAYRRTLLYMCNRLKEERLTYDNTLRAYEEALTVRREEAGEVRAMAVEVRMAKAREERELARSKHLVNQEKVRWENQLEDRRQVARKREEQKVNLEEKKRRERQAALEESKREQKEHDRNKKSNSAIAARTNNMTLDQIKDKLEFYQKTFQEIRLATGLSSVDDIVERLNQREHYGIEMQNEIDKKRLKTEQLRNRKSELLRKMEAVKFSGTGATDFNRDMIDKLSKSQDEFVRRLKVVREEHERVEKIILEIRQSISVMAQKLVHIDVETPVSPTHNSGGGRSGSRSKPQGNEGGGGKASDTMNANGNSGIEATVREIQSIENRLTRLMEVLDEGAEAGHRRPQGGEEGATEMQPKTDLNNIMDELIANNKHNVRVRPSTPRNQEHLLLRGATLSPDRQRTQQPAAQKDNSRPTTAEKGGKGRRDNNDDKGNGRRNRKMMDES